METIKLNNGVLIPILGFGTWRNKGEECFNSVLEALKFGYRHIDTAWVYGNEKEVGKALKASGIDRSELFITTKRWNEFRGYEETKKAFNESLKNLQLDYIDLYLLHWPKELDVESYKAMEELYLEGKIKAIGVSNYQLHHLEALMKETTIVPMVNQIEFSPRLTQVKLREYCSKHNIAVEAWSPLMQGHVFEIETLKELSQKYNKTVAQIVLRFNIDLGIIVIPKSKTPSRILENFEVFNFKLESEDINKILDLNLDRRMGPDPDNFDF